MARRSAIMVAGFLTTVVMAIFALTLNVTLGGQVAFGAQSPESPSTSVTLPSVDEETDFYTDVEAQAKEVYRQREAALQAQVAAAKRSVTEQDVAYQAELARLQEALTQVEQSVDTITKDAGAFNALSSITQQQIQQDEADFQQDLAQLQVRDSQLQQQLDAALFQLQAAYDEIAMRQASQVQSYAGGSGGGGDQNNGDAYEDDDHDDDDHDDDHGDHDDDEHEHHDDDDDDD